MAGIGELKEENIRKVRECFYIDGGRWTRPALSERTGLSMAALANVLQALMQIGEIRYAGDAPRAVGRPSKEYELLPDYAHIGMVFLSHQRDRFSILAESMNLRGEKVSRLREDWGADQLQETEVNEVKPLNPWEKDENAAVGAGTVARMAHKLFHSDPALKCLTVSVPGILSSDGMVRRCDFPGLAGVNLKSRLEEALHIPIRIENDVNLAAVGYGRCHPECGSLAVLYQPDSDPAGVGVLIDRKLYRGHGGYAGEIGQFETEAQMRLLRAHPEELVLKQMAALACCFAPERIAWYCPVVETEILFDISAPVPHVPGMPGDVLPVLDRLDDLEKLTRLGAEVFGREILLENKSA